MIVTIDTGGTKTLIASFDSEGNIGEQYRFPTPKDKKQYIDTLVAALKERYKPGEVDAISMAVPGVIKDNVVLWCGNLPWRNFAIAKELERHYACPIHIHNDADLAGLAEANVFETPPPLCLYVTVSTGIGSGIIINGRLTPELSGSEAGHMLIEYDGRVRTWESFASGQAIRNVYGKYAYEITDKETWNKIADSLARGFTALIPPLQPEVIVLGGSIGTHFHQYEHALNRLLDDWLPPYILRPKIVKASHPEMAVIYGCYYHAVHQILR